MAAFFSDLSHISILFSQINTTDSSKTFLQKVLNFMIIFVTLHLSVPVCLCYFVLVLETASHVQDPCKHIPLMTSWWLLFSLGPFIVSTSRFILNSSFLILLFFSFLHIQLASAFLEFQLADFKLMTCSVKFSLNSNLSL